MDVQGEKAEKEKLQVKVTNKDPSIRLLPLQGKSEVLQKFHRVELDGSKTSYAACKTCVTCIKYIPEAGTSGLKRHTCKSHSESQPQIDSFLKRKLPAGVKGRITDKIARMCCQDLRPFAIVEGRGFKAVAQELLRIGAAYGSSIEAEDLLPSARTVSRHIEGEYDRVKATVLEELKQVCILAGCTVLSYNTLLLPSLYER